MPLWVWSIVRGRFFYFFIVVLAEAAQAKRNVLHGDYNRAAYSH
jgi:hypothetical protein